MFRRNLLPVQKRRFSGFCPPKRQAGWVLVKSLSTGMKGELSGFPYLRTMVYWRSSGKMLVTEEKIHLVIKNVEYLIYRMCN